MGSFTLPFEKRKSWVFEPVCLEDLSHECDVMSKLKLLNFEDVFSTKMAKGKHVVKESCFFSLIYWDSLDFSNGGEVEILLHEN